MADPLESFTSVVRDALGERIDPGARTFIEMFAENGVMEFPFAPPGRQLRVVGREALAAYLGSLGGVLAFDRFSDPVVHPSTDAAVVILEFQGFGRVVSSGATYEQRYISVIHTSGGRIVRYRDYWDPLAVVKATHGDAAVEALLRGDQ